MEPQTSTPIPAAAAQAVHYRPHRDRKSSHAQIAALVGELARRGEVPVLDVGCAQGMLGQALARDGQHVPIDGIEPNATWAQMARPAYRNVWASTVEQSPLEPKTYRVIVCADVLEHLADPVTVLTHLRDAATDDATFIISVPNIAHLAVRLMLLFGKFPKMERGILDRTHLQYLTKDTAADMLRAAGLEPQRVLATPVPVDELLKRDRGLIFSIAMKAQHVMIAVLPRLFSMQWIFIARPMKPRTSQSAVDAR